MGFVTPMNPAERYTNASSYGKSGRYETGIRVCYPKRNGQMAPGEYIDLQFDGNRISYEQAKQHIPQTPF